MSHVCIWVESFYHFSILLRQSTPAVDET